MTKACYRMMATRGWLPGWPESYILEVGTMCLYLVVHHTGWNTARRGSTCICGLTAKKKPKEDGDCSSVRAVPGERAVIHSLDSAHIFCKPIWFKAVGQPLRRTVMANEAQLLASRGCHPLKGRLQQKQPMMGFQRELS